jgi:hypothetical protein
LTGVWKLRDDTDKTLATLPGSKELADPRGSRRWWSRRSASELDDSMLAVLLAI